MISKAELLMGRDTQYPNDYTPEISSNLDSLLIPLNGIRAAYGKPMIVVSGWRPPEVNAECGGANKSKHMIGLATDIMDGDGQLWNWVIANLPLMKSMGLFMEDKRWTKTWVHFQVGQPQSGHRIFVPNASRPTDMTIWNGIYDTSLNEEPLLTPA